MGTQGTLNVVVENNIMVVSFLEVSFLDETSIKTLGDELEALINEKINKKQDINLVIDFSNIEYLSSAVLGRLVKIYKLVKKSQGKVKLCSIKNNILQVFKVTKLDNMFEIHPDRNKALQSFKGGLKLFGKK
jgi:anti-sigma B factor antagonist